MFAAINQLGYYFWVEKPTHHCKLSTVKSLVKAGKVKATVSAFNGARDLGISDLAGMCRVVVALNTANFYKSMTTHADHKMWQDVYHARTQHGEAYLKLTVIDDVLIVSFKEL